MDTAKTQLKFLKDAHAQFLQDERKERFNDLMHRFKALKDSENFRKQLKLCEKVK